ncbi:dynein heavy chain 6, axonemal-like isoform X2 [Gigantopelta aegis]|uniref:dynein heavy chain 6, axonemal-like isoform X2 n=1 Tax=Gigantopelta aegis TaxID=1735272 RepID=UPI001B889727|nr:dynein heavy chain 6, axonemal-like isoform X2 [Gigantopelta aegis]
MSRHKQESCSSPISLLSESTVLNEDLENISLLESEIFPKTAQSQVTDKIARFNVDPFQVKNRKQKQIGNVGPSQVKPAEAREKVNIAEQLRDRLYDKPENSDVLVNVHLQSKKAFCPRPPSGKRDRRQVPGFRTTLFKKDYERRQIQLKVKPSSSIEPIPCIQKIMERSVAAHITETTTVPPLVEPAKSELTDDQDLHSIIFSDTDKISDSEEKSYVVCYEDDKLDKATEDTEKIGEDLEKSVEDSETNVFIEKKTPEVQFSFTEKDKDVRYVVSERLRDIMKDKSSMMSFCALSRLPVEAPPLSYLKKNWYDDPVLDSDDGFTHLIAYRSQLGWVTEIPHHGPLCRKQMEALTNDQPISTAMQKLVTSAKEDDGKFVYCVLRNRDNPRARYDPYNLQVVSADKARSQRKYWTVSASSVTMWTQDDNNHEESSSTPALWWLWERRLFYHITQLPSFVKFRIWKTFKVWVKSIRKKKNSHSRMVLYKSLFVANEVLQGCLFHVKTLCETAKGCGKDVDGSSVISLLKHDRSKTMTLQEFTSAQVEQGKLALAQLNALRNKIIEVAWESCATVAEMEGITQGIRGDKKVKINIPKTKSDTDIVVSRNRLKKPKGPTTTDVRKGARKDRPLYAEIAEWRKILERLSCFLRAVDYMLMDLLRHLVMTALQDVLDHFVASYNTSGEDDLDSDSESVKTSSRDSSRMMVLVKKKGPVQPKAPELYVIPHFDFEKAEEIEGIQDIDEVLYELKHREDVEEVVAAVFNLSLVLDLKIPKRFSIMNRRMSKIHNSPPIEGTESPTKKKIVKFPDEKPMSDSDESEYSDSDYEDESSDEDLSRNRFAYEEKEQEIKHVAVSKTFISLSPSEISFKNAVFQIVDGFENTIGQVVPMLRESRLAVFYSPPKHDIHLHYDEEEEEERRTSMQPWPDLDLLLHEDPHYQYLLQELTSYINMEMELIKQFCLNYDQFCRMVDQCKLLDVEESMSKKTWSAEEFNHVLRSYTDMIARMKNMVTNQRIAMIDVDAKGFQETCLPYAEKVLDAIHKKLPVIANKRNEDLLKIIKGASKRLDQYPSSVEAFVEHLSFLGRMSNELPALEKEFLVVNKFFTIAREFQMNIEPEELALYQTLGPSFQHLKTMILYCEAKKDQNIRKFSSDLESLVMNIQSKLMDLKNRVRDPDLLNSDTMMVSALETIRYLQDEVQSLSLKARSYASYQERFGSSLSKAKKGFIGEEYMYTDTKSEESAQAIETELSEIERDLTLRRLLWQSLDEWTRLVDEWTASSFDSVPVESLQKNVNKFTQTVYMLEKGLPHNEILPRLKEMVMKFKQGMPVITSLRNPSLRSRHWEQIQRIINKVIARDKSFTLGNLLDMNIFQHKEKIQDISTTASNEATLEHMLNKITSLWLNTDFRLLPHGGRDTSIIAGADDIMAQLEESQVTIGTIRGSRYVGPIKAQVEEWERKLQVFSRTLDEWLNCQRNWLYLEQIFGTPDIQRQLPSEYKLFSEVDKAWKDIMRRVEDRPNALKSAIAPGTLETLQSANANLEKIQKCLEDYLETKRLVFPRFYFLSNDELLDILAQSKDPEAVQPHLGKCFGNVKHLAIQILPRQPPTVTAITSAEGEIIDMPRNVRARGPVEQWLGTVEYGMFETVKKHLKLGMTDIVVTETKEWVVKHPGQVVLTVTQIVFNKDVSQCFDEFDVCSALIVTRNNMLELLSQLAHLVSTHLKPWQRESIEALLTITVHDRDIIKSLISNKVVRREDFEWKKQLRYEWDEQSNNCQVLQSNAVFLYGYEYLGCSSRLVITPLTDRCYLTLTGALHLHLGGSPAGPAGTGKTETVKDLAKAMGKQCVVFNCSEGLDYKMLGKFFSGLSQSGSWCCFDEFNRIDVEVLSVVAQQIHTIKAAKDQLAPRFMFEGRDIKLNLTCGFFITMNPTYAGRVELPDNLKSLFRSVAMMVPDYALIAEIMLFSEGFVEAKSLSYKIVNLYNLASKQLSQQDHYDFGMRAIKSVLVMAGHGRRRAQHKDDNTIKKLTSAEESYILIHSLRDANLPKFLSEDVPLFESILADLFPGVVPPEPDQGVLEKAISMAIRDQGLQHWPNQMEKVKQFYSQIMVRHGVMLVGPTGGGKTTIRQILQKTLVLLPTIAALDTQGAADLQAKRPSMFHSRSKKGQVDSFLINPKCVKLGELYGETNPTTFEWTDGLIASATRKFAKEESVMSQANDGQDRSETAMTGMSEATQFRSQNTYQTDSSATMDVDPATPMTDDAAAKREMAEGTVTNWHWLILDGPVDTLWVENLNTVLDDSKVLCLANGERISLTPGMRLIFEVDNLSQASPATISRCAMVYMDPVDLGWRPSVKTWLQHLPRDLPDSGKQHLQALFEHSIEKGLAFLRKYKHFQMITVPELSIVSSLCHILMAYLDFISKNGGFGNPDKEDLRPPSSDSRSSSRGSAYGTSSRASRAKKRGTKKQNKFNLATMDENQPAKVSTAKQFFLMKSPGQLLNLLGKLFVFAFAWSMGGTLKRQEDSDDDDTVNRRGADKMEREVNICFEFDNFVREVFEIEPPLGIRLPAGSRSIFSYFIDMESGHFIPWDTLVPSTKSLIEKGLVITIGETMGVMTDNKKGYESKEAEIVPTVDILRFSFLTSLLVLNKHPVLLTGDSGVGKSAIINYMLKRLEKEGGTSFNSGTILGDIFQYSERQSSILENISMLTKFGDDDNDKNMDEILGTSKPKLNTGILSTTIQFSAQTSSARLQAQIMHKLIKKSKDSLGAPKGRKVIVFVDDLNMPAPEEYGAQPPLELLRLFLESGGFYDTKKIVWKDIVDVTLVSACGPPGGGRNPTSPRLLKHFCMLSLPTPSTRSLQHIYQVQLGRFLQDGEFMPEVNECVFSFVSASIAVYYRMCGSMLPTPTKSHYTFNIRDLSKVIQGLLQAHNSVIVTKDNCAQLFAHEATRVFHDRLINNEDRLTFNEILSDNLHDYFKVTWSAEKLMNNSVLFGDFFDIDEEVNRHIYRPISDYAKLSRVLEELHIRMHFGNIESTQFVFFKDAVEHILRASRVFRQPGGHLMLVGMDGTGKSTIVNLAAYISDCELFRLTLNKSYNIPEFRDDLKKVFLKTGVQNKNTAFLLTDSDIVKESFLEDINCILNSGEVPDLFDNEELDGITVDLKGAASEAEVPDTRAAVYQFFLQRVHRKLHVVLTMSPAGGVFRQRCRMNPALINCCTIDWYDKWSDEAMYSVAQVFFENTEFIADSQYDIEELKGKVAHVCVNFQQIISDTAERYWQEMRRRYYTTPSSYMELIKLYTRMLTGNKTELIKNKERLQVGLSKLSEANDLVGVMQEELVTLGPRIEEKARDTEVLLVQLEKDQEAVEQVRKIVEEEESIMKKETQIVQDYAAECHKDLASVLPALQTAIASLETLDKASISEIRVYSKPPALVKTVMAAVCVLFQKTPDWATARLMLSDPGFLRKLLQFDKNSLPDRVFVKLKKYSKNPDFIADSVGKVSVACRSICEWVLALEHYNDVYKMVKPKQRRVEEAKEALSLAEDHLAKKQASLRKIENHLKLIQQQYQDSVNQREGLKERKKITALRLQRASVLISALADEKVRWAVSVQQLNVKLKSVVGDNLVSAAAVAYLGAFTAKYRKDLVEKWITLCQKECIPLSEEFDLVMNMVDANSVMKWQTGGLPRDAHSTENATFVKKARKWPLLIDPQEQAVNWVREMEGQRLKSVGATDPHLMRTIETAIRVGAPVLVEDVGEHLDPALRPVIAQQTFQRGGHLIIIIGDTEIEYNQNFRLYLATSMANPHYLPSVFIGVNIINFTVTFDGLQEQLLSSVVKKERPYLESQRMDLLESITSDRQLLRDLENKSLGLLQKSEGHILDDQDLVDTLQKSKGMAEEIYHRVNQSEETEKKLNIARKRYLPVATRGAVLYFVLADLASIDVMYQFSLTWFQDMFSMCISSDGEQRTPTPPTEHLSGVLRPSSVASLYKDSDTDSSNSSNGSALHKELEEVMSHSELEVLKKHLRKMIDRLTYSIYRVVCVGLFAYHQLMFSFMITSSVMRVNSKFEDHTSSIGNINETEWLVFLQGSIMASMTDSKVLTEHDGLTSMERLESEAHAGDKEWRQHKTPPKWINGNMWLQCQHLDATLTVFDKMCRSILTCSCQWDAFCTADNPYTFLATPFVLESTGQEGEENVTPGQGFVFQWENLSCFQRLILIKILRLDMLSASVATFIEEQLGQKYLSTGAFDLKEVYEDSKAKTPLIFILSPGCDPATQLLRFAKELRGSTLHLDMISLGRGQGPKAEELISKAQILKGRWVFLQNCHLAASWMPRLQAIVQKFSKPNTDTDPQFRLWLSSKPDPCFPISILQTGIKMTVESPQGIKNNMQRMFGSGGTGIVTEKLYNEGVNRPEWRKLLFGLCLFNSVILERKKYGTLGWNIPYEFNDSDLEVSLLKLQMLLEEQDTVPWTALRYLTGEVTFGGRVTDDWDRRCLLSMLGRFYCENILKEDHTFSADGQYKPIPDTYTLSDVIKYVEELPNYEYPDMLGMTDNAEKTCREIQAGEFIDIIVSVQPRIYVGLTGSQKSNDEIVLDICTDIDKHLPKSIEETDDADTANKGTRLLPRYSLKSLILKESSTDLRIKQKDRLMLEEATDSVLGNSALITVLRQEIDRFNNLLHIIHKSLSELTQAVKGEIIMSDLLEDAYKALLTQRVPAQWKMVAYESRKPLASWVRDLVNRVDFFSLWAELITGSIERKFKALSNVNKPASQTQTATSPDDELEDTYPIQPHSFWLPGFFFPQGFLTAVSQNHARKQNISVDSLTFEYIVQPVKTNLEEDPLKYSQNLKIKEAAFTSNHGPEDGVLIFGLFLDGARWDPTTYSLQDLQPGHRFCCLPEIHFMPVQIQIPSSVEKSGSKTEQDDDQLKAKGKESQTYECPLYRTSTRAGTLSSTGHSTNFVSSVDLPSVQPPDFWVLRGAAMLCQLDQ